MTLHIYSYNENSKGVKELQKKLGIKRIKNEGSHYKGQKNKYIINWGASDLPSESYKSTILNKPDDIARNSNKLHFFNHQNSAEYPAELVPWTTELDKVIEWLVNGNEVLGRLKLTGHSGEGIQFITENNLNEYKSNCRLYTKYVKKKDEYRVHIFQSEVILIQRKALKYKDKNNGEYKVRNREAGYIYQINDVKPPRDVIEQALLCFDNSGLDFGAVDILWNEHYKKAYVCEINTAPGLVGNTIDVYAEKFKHYL